MTVPKPPPARQLLQVLIRYTQIRGAYTDDLRYASEAEQTEIYTALVTTIERLAPQGTYYNTALTAAVERYGINNNAAIPTMVGIAEALKAAYESGFLHQIEELIRADLFADFLDMSEFLLDEAYKDPAAVIIGGVLEEHLRKLCLKTSIAITMNDRPKKADTMNADLAKSDVYNVLDQKSITAWLDLRNKAAHGRYDEYTHEHVALALQGIRGFVARFPA